MADRIERFKWWLADRVNQTFHRRQCWADLVSWVLDTERTRDVGVAAKLPWRHRNLLRLPRRHEAVAGREPGPTSRLPRPVRRLRP